MNEYKLCSHYGPGGRFCTCCGPAPRQRKRFDRSIKRRGRQMTKKEIQKWIAEE